MTTESRAFAINARDLAVLMRVADRLVETTDRKRLDRHAPLTGQGLSPEGNVVYEALKTLEVSPSGGTGDNSDADAIARQLWEDALERLRVAKEAREKQANAPRRRRSEPGAALTRSSAREDVKRLLGSA